jgi:hypothetical protein
MYLGCQPPSAKGAPVAGAPGTVTTRSSSRRALSRTAAYARSRRKRGANSTTSAAATPQTATSIQLWRVESLPSKHLREVLA